MAEEGNGESGPETPVVTDTSTPFISEDGTLNEGWREHYLDETIRAEPYFAEVKDVQSVFKSVIAARSMVGKDKMVVPNENSSEGDWDAAYTALGRPDTAADYNFQRPEEFPEELYNTDLANAAQDMFHKMGLSHKQANTLLAWNLEQTLSAVKQQEIDAELQQKTLVDGLYSDWGNAYEQKKHLANVAIEKGTEGDDEFKARVLEKFGNDPDGIRLLANVGSKFAEHGSVETSLIPTPGDIDIQIAELMQTAAFRGGPGIPQEEHLAMVNKVFALRESKHVKRTA